MPIQRAASQDKLQLLVLLTVLALVGTGCGMFSNDTARVEEERPDTANIQEDPTTPPPAQMDDSPSPVDQEQNGPYDPQANAQQNIDAALAQARVDQKHVLLDFGANWCPDCLALASMLEQDPVSSFVAENYHVVSIDVGEWDNNLDIAAAYGNPIEQGIPAVVVLDPQGEIVTTTQDGAMANARTSTPEDILAYLRRWAPGAASAATVAPTRSSPVGPTRPDAPSSETVSAIEKAYQQTRMLDVYRMEFQANDAAQDITATSFTGAFNGDDIHFSLQQPGLTSTGFDPEVGLQIIHVDGNTYAHGPLPGPNATESVWYALDSSMSAAANPPMGATIMLDALLNSSVKLADFTRSGQESLDGQQCDVYTATQWPAMNALNGLGISTTGEEPTLEEQMQNINLEDATMRLWLCEDGYLHQIDLSASGSSRANPEKRFDTNVNMHLSDINGDVTITAPADAVPFKQ